MKQEILIETYTSDEAHVITESSVDGKDAWLSGIFMQSEIKNRNGRVYPLSEISRAVESAKTTIQQNNGIYGELDHPQTLSINLDRISHMITDVYMNGNNAEGKAKIIKTPMGAIAEALIRSGGKIGMSSRGAGSVSQEGKVSDFNFVTMDLVATPSAPGAVPNAVYESLMMDKHGVEALSLAEHVRGDKAAQKYFKKEILKFLESGLIAKR